MYLVHERTAVVAYGFPSEALATVYAHAYVSSGGSETIRVSYHGYCNLTKDDALVYVGQRICPYTGETVSILQESKQ